MLDTIVQNSVTRGTSRPEFEYPFPTRPSIYDNGLRG